MRILHAADLHLGFRVTRFGKEVNNRVREARFQALDNLLTVAKDRQVDAVLIAGDLFDDNHVDAATSRRAQKMLDALGIPVFIIPGNHDPLTPDSVWERPPWNTASAGTVQVLRRPEPVHLAAGAILYPCPLTRKTSLEDPTRWIPARAAGDATIRIGMAHGSLRDRENLPEDDHLIERYLVDDRGLDYLALGHWHRPARYPDRKGVIRTVYPGVHEPMRFPASAGFATGWSPYSNAAAGAADLFADDGRGRVAIVTVDRAGAEPAIEEVEVGHLSWTEETHALEREEDLAKLIENLAKRPNAGRQLLRLKLEGVLSPNALATLDELDASLSDSDGEGVLRRYFWYRLSIDGLHAAPEDDDLRQVVGAGVLRSVYQRLREDETSADESVRQRAAQALLVLYHLARKGGIP
jgi:DNA repair exonuclease SbcCD nuclease subunit